MAEVFIPAAPLSRAERKAARQSPRSFYPMNIIVRGKVVDRWLLPNYRETRHRQNDPAYRKGIWPAAKVARRSA